MPKRRTARENARFEIGSQVAACVAETRTRSVIRVYMTYRDLVMAALSCWSLICDF